MNTGLQQTAIALISQYGDEAVTIAMLRAAEYASALNEDEWARWEAIIKIIETINSNSTKH
jgi:phosphoserine phosphatase